MYTINEHFIKYKLNSMYNIIPYNIWAAYLYSEHMILYFQWNDLIMDLKLFSKLSNNAFRYQMSSMYISTSIYVRKEVSIYLVDVYFAKKQRQPFKS